MFGKIILHVKNGFGPDREIVLRDRTLCMVGRADGCFLRFPDPEISRRHCLLDIDPPYIHIRDLGSRNGTFVNGEPIGRRTPDQSPEEVRVSEMPEHELHEGDEVRIGSSWISVGIEEPADVIMTKEEPEAVGV
jgi:eukaryotic-like serine/threonine-protein kinase